ncbi:MAG: SoxR reducing system RseC family protein [Colwellia sp.]
MAIIEATVVNVNADGITVSASREGGCKSCSQNEHCAILWQHDLKEKIVSMSAPSKVISQGDVINLHCDERSLLLYISILFVPTLMMLLLSTLTVEFLFSDLTAASQILISLFIAFMSGIHSSRFLLDKFDHKLLKPTRINPT